MIDQIKDVDNEGRRHSVSWHGRFFNTLKHRAALKSPLDVLT
jgi:hypothetical protein